MTCTLGGLTCAFDAGETKTAHSHSGKIAGSVLATSRGVIGRGAGDMRVNEHTRYEPAVKL